MSKVHFIVATHGKSAKALLETVEMLMGETTDVTTVDFLANENADSIVAKYQAIIEKEGKDKEYLFFVDIWGGSPFNSASLVSKEVTSNVIAGVNIPQLISGLEARDEGLSLEEITKEVLTQGREGVKSLYFNTEVQVNNSVAIIDADEDDEDFVPSTEIEKANDGPHLVVALARIDERLIHGQVATVWVKTANVSRIVVVSDAVAKDKIRTEMLKAAAPAGITAHVVTVAKATRVYNNPEYAGERILFLFTQPQELLTLIDAGWDIPTINVGSMAYKEGRTLVTNAVCVGPEDVEVFKEIDKRGIELEIRKVAADSKLFLMKELEKLNLLNKE